MKIFRIIAFTIFWACLLVYKFPVALGLSAAALWAWKILAVVFGI